MILRCYLAKPFLSLYGDYPMEAFGDKGRIYPKTCRQIDKQFTFSCNASLISRRLFARTLFHGEMRRIDHPILDSPRGDFDTRFLAPGYLFQSIHQVYLGILEFPKCQLMDISLSMLTDKIESRLIHVPIFLPSANYKA